mmetsp:Transcript_37375/g.94873  ORF Transcript_37375/g.94873 Transcript_37375/m.94873 type:complete len:290 (-) Transcript_37375:353-1222(-)
MSLERWVAFDPLSPGVQRLDRDPLVGGPLGEVGAHRTASVQRVAIPAAAWVEVVPQDDRAFPRGHLESPVARLHVGVEGAGAMSCPLSTAEGWLANRLAMLREECLATFLHIVEVPEDCRQPTLVPKVAADPDVPLVVVQLQLSPVHVAVIVLPLAVAEQLHRLVVARRHPREVGDSQVQLRDQRRKTVAQPSLLGGAELRVLRAGLKIPALHLALRGVEALLLAEAHDLLCLLPGEELSDLEHLRPEGQRPQQRGAPAHVPELLLEADAHSRPHPDADLQEKGHRSRL